MSEEKVVRNQGLSLVELLVAVAALGIAMIGITALMGLSAKYFASSSKEVEIQTELQTTFALVSNMIVDANVSVTYDESTKTAVITNSKYKYFVVLDGTKLYAKEVAATSTETASSIVDLKGTNMIADHVDLFEIDKLHYSDGYVTLKMKVSYGSREATMARNVFLRNSRTMS